MPKKKKIHNEQDSKTLMTRLIITDLFFGGSGSNRAWLASANDPIFFFSSFPYYGFLWWLSGKESTCTMQETQVRSLIWEDLICCGATKPRNCNY